MNRVGAFLQNRPFLSAALVAGALAAMTSGLADFRTSETDSVNMLGSYIVLGLMLVGLISALVLVPRTSADVHEEKLVFLRWAYAVGIYMIGFNGWFLFGLPSWVITIGAVTAVGVLFFAIRESRPADDT